MLNIFKKIVEEPCDHDWEVIDSKIMDAPIEIMKQSVGANGQNMNIKTRGHEELIERCTVKYVCVVRCKGTCGGLKKYVIRNTGPGHKNPKPNSGCKHDWHVLETTVLPSPIEILNKIGLHPTTEDPANQLELATNRYLCVVACKAGCGDVRIATETNQP